MPCAVVCCVPECCAAPPCSALCCAVVRCAVCFAGLVPLLAVSCPPVLSVALESCAFGRCVLCRRRCYQKAKGRDVYRRVKVNGLGCVCCVRAVRKCVGLGRGRGSRGDLLSSPLATALIPGAPAAPLPFLLAGAGAAPATPTPSCCPCPGGPSAVWHAPWRWRT